MSAFAACLADFSPVIQAFFETEKEILRKQIRAALAKAKTLDEFFDFLLEDYGVAVKESRGRFSYLTADRTKPITSRKLGDDFSKEAILAALEQNAARVIPSARQKTDAVTLQDKPEIQKLTRIMMHNLENME